MSLFPKSLSKSIGGKIYPSKSFFGSYSPNFATSPAAKTSSSPCLFITFSVIESLSIGFSFDSWPISISKSSSSFIVTINSLSSNSASSSSEKSTVSETASFFICSSFIVLTTKMSSNSFVFFCSSFSISESLLLSFLK